MILRFSVPIFKNLPEETLIKISDVLEEVWFDSLDKIHLLLYLDYIIVINFIFIHRHFTTMEII